MAKHRLDTKVNQTPAGKALVACAHVAEPFEMAFLNLTQDVLVQISQHVIILILHCHFDTIRRMDKPLGSGGQKVTLVTGMSPS